MKSKKYTTGPRWGDDKFVIYEKLKRDLAGWNPDKESLLVLGTTGLGTNQP